MKVITIIAAAVAASLGSAHPVPPCGDLPHCREKARLSQDIDDKNDRGKVVLARSPNPDFYSEMNEQAWRLDMSDCLGGNRSDVSTSDSCTAIMHMTPIRVSPDARDIKGLYDELTELTQLEGTSTWLYMPGQPLSGPGLSKRGEEPDKPTIPPHGTPDRSHMSPRFDTEKPTIPPHGMPDRSHMSHRFDTEKPTIPPHGMPDRSHMSPRFDAGGWFIEPSKKLHLPRQQWDNMMELRRNNGGDVSSMFARGSNSPEAPGLATSSVDTASPVPRSKFDKICLQCIDTDCHLTRCQFPPPPLKVVDKLEKRAQDEKAKKEQKVDEKRKKKDMQQMKDLDMDIEMEEEMEKKERKEKEKERKEKERKEKERKEKERKERKEKEKEEEKKEAR
ncbi:hypothetical protein EsDP_00001752 [Epichloe bromicola]|uniref:Uncharacterized protein n=1 Tax=Epichloe bromicola TaxID=79588 RepID=A0ABQ0CIS8_9HYPO